MNHDIKKQWVEALRSGEYQQTQDWLHDDSGYCCLGVLCDLAVKAGVVEVTREHGTDGETRYGSAFEGAELPFEVMSWAGLNDPNPEIFLKPSREVFQAVFGLEELETEEEYVIADSLAGMNDGGYTFTSIAAIIEIGL